MKITVEPTEQFFMVGDVMVRAWKGEGTLAGESGKPVVVLIAVVVFTDQNPGDIPGLVSIPPPDTETARKWATEVMSRRPWEDNPNG